MKIHLTRLRLSIILILILILPTFVFSQETNDIHKIYLKIIDDKYTYKILNFWATWCLPCVEEMKSLNNFQDQFISKENPALIKLFLINGDRYDNEKEYQTLLKKIKKRVPHNIDNFVDSNEYFFKKFNIKNVPTTIILKDNKIIKTFENKVDFMSHKFLDIFNKSEKIK
jgi:thiol-disulfide isomerase/thioredoxin